MASKISSLAALAGLSALGAFLVVAQGQAASLPVLKPTLAPSAKTATAEIKIAQPTTPDGRVVRVVYPSPFAQK